MFDSLKKKLKESIEKLSRKAEGGEKAEQKGGIAEQRKAEAPEDKAPAFPEPITEARKEPVSFKAPEAKPRKAASKEIKDKERPEPKRAKERRIIEKKSEAKPEDMPLPGEPIPISAKVKEKEQEPQAKEKRGFLGRFREKVTTKTISSEDVEQFFSENETDMLEANVAMEVVDFLKQRLKENLAQKQAKRFGTKNVVQEAFEDSLYDVVNHGEVDLEGIIAKAKSEGRPACLIFLGFNGSGKTTSAAKLASYLKSRGHTPVLAAADTFRAASIEQLEVHGERIGVKVIKHQYGADSAAVVFDAVKFAKTKGYDIVIADTAGRSHADKNLMDELSKVVRVNRPDLRVLVVDSLTGNDAVEQAKMFEKAAGVDAIVLTKVDVNKKGGAILSVSYAIKKPILFLGVGQDYANIEMFEPRKFAKELIE